MGGSEFDPGLHDKDDGEPEVIEFETLEAFRAFVHSHLPDNPRIWAEVDEQIDKASADSPNISDRPE